MKILILTSWYLPAGAFFIKEQALFLKERGFEVDVMANNSVSITQNRMHYFTLPWRIVSTDEDGLLTYRRFTRYIPRSEKTNMRRWVKGTLAVFEKYVEEQGLPDLIHTHSSMWGGYAASLIKKRYNVPYLITEHLGIMALQCDFARTQFPEWRNHYFKSAFSNANYIVPVSEQLMRKISEFTSSKTPWRAIPNIVDTDFFSCRKRFRKGNFRFVCVNGYYPEKGYDILLQAFDLFCQNDSSSTLTIAGENFEHPDFQQLLSKCKNRNRISFTGELNREEVRNLLWEADAFLLPSRVESQSISTLEAMSTGLPVICTDVVPEFMTPPMCGYRVANENTNLFAEKMLQMVENASTFDAEFISNHTRKVAHKEVILDAVTAVYREIIDERR